MHEMYFGRQLNLINMILIAIGVVICFVLVWLVRSGEKKSLELSLLNRECIPVQKQLESNDPFMTLDREKAVKLWKELAGLIGVNPEKLRFNDRFDTELAPMRGSEFDGYLVSITLFLKGKMARSNLDIDFAQIKSIGDCIQRTCGR